jgi:hypothetical protein
MAVTMKNAVIWYVTPCNSCKNRHLRGTYRQRHQLLATAIGATNSLILVTLMTEATLSSEMCVPRRATSRNISENGILRSHRRENLKSYIALTGRAL